MKQMRIYNYHHLTGEFKSEWEARPNPIEEGKFLIPAHATTKKPLKPKVGNAVVFDVEKQEWKYVPDFRGTMVYSKQTGQPFLINQVGEIPDDYTATKMPNNYSEFVDGEWKENEGKKRLHIREKASKLIDVAAWHRDQYREQTELDLTPTLSHTQYLEVLQYILQLRNYPETGVLPAKPSFI